MQLAPLDKALSSKHLAMAVDEKVLSYYDSLVTKSDVALLSNNSWLNDTLVDFYFQYVFHALIASLQCP